MKVPFVVVIAATALTGVETLLQGKDVVSLFAVRFPYDTTTSNNKRKQRRLIHQDQQQGNNAFIIKSTRQNQETTDSDNYYRQICYYNKHGRSLSSIQLFASSSTSSGSTVNNDDDNNDDDDDDEISSKYDVNKKQNRQWLKDKFQFTTERLNKNSYDYTSLTQNNSVLEERTNWLQDTLGFKDNEMNRIIQLNPLFLGNKIDTNLEPTLECLKKTLKLKKTSLKKMILKYPRVLGCKPEGIEPKLRYLQRRLNLDETQAGKIIMTHPAILSYSIENSIKPIIDWLEQLGLTGTQVSKTIQRCPQMLGMSISENLEPTVLWLKERLVIDDIQVGKMVRGQPRFLGLTIDTINSKLNWLLERSGTSHSDDTQQITKMIVRYPHLINFSISDKMEPNLEWIQNRLSITNSELFNMVRQQPSLMGYDVRANLEPKIQFYLDSIETDETDEDVLAYIVRDPRLLTSSLDGRLQPRLEQVKEYKKKIDIACLRKIAKLPPEKWDKWVASLTA